jgi:hypothetical protein
MKSGLKIGGSVGKTGSGVMTGVGEGVSVMVATGSTVASPQAEANKSTPDRINNKIVFLIIA